MSKKEKKQFVFTILALVVCVVGYLLIDAYCEDRKEKEEDESKRIEEESRTVVFEMDNTDDITGFSYVVDGETITLLKDTDGVWICDNDTSMNVDQSTVNNTMVSNFVYVSSNQVIESPEDTAQYGFDDPQNKIVIMKSDGTSCVFTIGAQNEFDTSKYYMMLEGDDNVYVIGSSIPNAFAYSLEDLREEETTTEETEEETIAEETTEEVSVEETEAE